MSELPTLSNTWTIDPNNQACDSGVDTLLECHQKTLFTLKDLLTNLPQPWTVVKSSNSVSHTDVDGYADYWDDSTDLVWSAGNHSWIVLEHPLWDFQICLDLNNSTGSGRLLSCYASHAGLFFGGDLSSRPVGQDEVFVFIDENWIGNNVAPFSSWVHTWQNNNGRQNKALITTSEGDGEGMFWSFHEVPTLSDLWENNKVSMIVTHRNVAGGGCLDLSRMMVTAGSTPLGLLSASNPVALLSAVRDDTTTNLFSKRSIRFNQPGYVQTEYLEVGDVSELNFDNTDPFSISFWVRAETTSSYYTVIGKRLQTGTFRGYAVFVNASSDPAGGGILQLYLGNNFGSNNFIRLYSDDVISDGSWHHVVWTHDGSSSASGMFLYIDGQSAGFSIDSDTLGATTLNSEPFQIGAVQGVFEMIGSIDDVAIFNTDLSAGQVATVYNSGVPNDLRETALSSNLVGYWLMGDGDTAPIVKDRANSTPILASGSVLDRSVSGNDGTPTNMEDADFNTDVPGGISGYSSLFDGVNESVIMGNILGFEFDDSFSGSCWFKTTATGGYLFSKVANFPTLRGWGIAMVASGGLGVFIQSDVSFPIVNPNRLQVDTNNSFNDGAWHHVCFTYDGSSSAAGVTIYVDGVLQAVTVIFDSLSGTIVSATNFSIAARTGGAGAFFAGRIDEVSVFDKELTSADVSLLYNSGAPSDITLIGTLYPNLVGYWGMGELHNDATAQAGLDSEAFWGDSPANPLLYLKLGSQLADPDDIGTSSMLTERDLANSPAGLDSSYPDIIDDGPSEFPFNTFSIELSNYLISADVGPYMTFDGSSDFLDGGNILRIQQDEPFSVSVWYRSSDTGVFQFMLGPFSQTSSFRGWEVGITSAGQLDFRISSTNLSNDLRVSTTATDPTYRDGSWKHVVFTYDGSTNASGVTIWVDGVSQSLTITTDNLTNPIAYNWPFYIARRVGGSYSDIDMTDISIFNEELSSAQVDALYNSGVPADIYENVDGYFTDSNVLAYFRLGTVRGEQNFPITPISLVSSYGYKGLHGYLPDMFWGSNFTGNITYPRSDSDKELVQFINVILPWTNDATAPSFVAEAANGDELQFLTVGGCYTGVGDTVGGATIDFYFLMTGIDTGAPTQPSYHSWVVIGSPDPTGAQAVGPDAPPFGGPLTNIIVSGQWSV